MKSLTLPTHGFLRTSLRDCYSFLSWFSEFWFLITAYYKYPDDERVISAILGICGPTAKVCDCSDIKASGQIANGVYEVCAGYLRDRVCTNAFCYMDAANGASLVCVSPIYFLLR